MSNLGKLLKELREKSKITLKAVKDKTGITDSRLSRMENGQCICPASELQKLADLYHFPVVQLFLAAEYLKPEDLIEYQYVFKGAEKLDEQERDFIQVGIDLLIRTKEKSL